MKKKLRLFVWEGYSPDYTDGIAFAIARTEEEARKKIIEVRGCEPYTWGTLTVHSLSKSIAFEVSGGG